MPLSTVTDMERIREIVRDGEKKTAILITHNLQEAKDFSERLCIWNLKEKRPEELDRSCMEELSILQYLMEHENGEN